MNQIRAVSRGITSNRLHKEIHDVLYETVTTISVKWTSDTHRTSFVEVIEEFFDDLKENGAIVQYRVTCDHRNNKQGFLNVKEHVLEVQYKQPHCLNTTSITFYIHNKRTNGI